MANMTNDGVSMSELLDELADVRDERDSLYAEIDRLLDTQHDLQARVDAMEQDAERREWAAMRADRDEFQRLLEEVRANAIHTGYRIIHRGLEPGVAGDDGLVGWGYATFEDGIIPAVQWCLKNGVAVERVSRKYELLSHLSAEEQEKVNCVLAEPVEK